MFRIPSSYGKQRPGESAFLSKISARTDLPAIKNLQQLPWGLGAHSNSAKEVQVHGVQVLLALLDTTMVGNFLSTPSVQVFLPGNSPAQLKDQTTDFRLGFQRFCSGEEIEDRDKCGRRRNTAAEMRWHFDIRYAERFQKLAFKLGLKKKKKSKPHFH